MKLKKIDMLIGEKLMCGRCGEWFANQYAGICVDDNDFYELLCEKCQKEEEEKETSERRPTKMETEQQIREELKWCEECIKNGDTTAWIQGRKYALLWVLGEEAE